MRRLLATGIIVVAAVVVSLLADRLLPVVRVAENWAADLRVATLTPAEPQSDQIIVATVTEDTLATFPYRSPLDRDFLANLLKALEAKGARLIGLDVLFDQPSEPAKDDVLRDTLRTLRVPVVTGWADTSDGLTERQSAYLNAFLEGVRHGVPMVIPDTVDGTVRTLLLGRGRGEEHQASFLAVIAETLGVQVPVQSSLALRYRNGPDAGTPAFASYPAHAVGLLPEEWFRDKIVLVGADLGFTDRHRTPLSLAEEGGGNGMAGVFILAHALAQILEGRPGPHVAAWQAVALVLLVAVVGAGLVMLNGPLFLRSAALAIAAGAVWVGGFALFQQGGPLIPLIAPTLSLALAAGLAYAWRWHLERGEKRYIREAFSKYVAPAVVDYMMKDPANLQLGGERRDTTFLFTDIAGYTTLTENTEPPLLVATMNEYLDGTCEIAFAHGGTLDKIVGDALHVIFNAPLDQEDHAERAVACALDMDAYCQAFAARKRAEGIEFGLTRIGVNTGVTVVGNFGGDKHFDYTATGDAINTAARLESVNKQLGTRICVSGTTVERCRNATFRPVGELILKGKSESVAAFEPVSNGDNSNSSVEEYLVAYQLLFTEDPQTKGAFSRLAERYPQDPLLRFHLERLEEGETGALIVMKEK
jgi:class 3 adenylate cyclase